MSLARGLFRSTCSVYHALTVSSGGNVSLMYYPTTGTVTVWPTTASGSWTNVNNAHSAPDSSSATASAILGGSTATLTLGGYSFSAVPDDAVITAFSVISHIDHNNALGRSWFVTVKDGDGNALGDVSPDTAGIAGATTIASESVNTDAAWTAAVTTKDLLESEVVTVECAGDAEDVETVVWTCDAAGGIRVTYTGDLDENVPCEIQADTTREGIEFQRTTGRTRYTGWFLYSQSIDLNDRIVWRSKTLEVKSPPRDPSGIQDHVEVTLEEIE
jgi:hypothetical protein